MHTGLEPVLHDPTRECGRWHEHDTGRAQRPFQARWDIVTFGNNYHLVIQLLSKWKFWAVSTGTKPAPTNISLAPWLYFVTPTSSTLELLCHNPKFSDNLRTRAGRWADPPLIFWPFGVACPFTFPIVTPRHTAILRLWAKSVTSSVSTWNSIWQYRVLRNRYMTVLSMQGRHYGVLPALLWPIQGKARSRRGELDPQIVKAQTYCTNMIHLCRNTTSATWLQGFWYLHLHPREFSWNECGSQIFFLLASV